MKNCNLHLYDCPRCGRYNVIEDYKYDGDENTDVRLRDIKDLTIKQKSVLSHRIFHQWNHQPLNDDGKKRALKVTKELINHSYEISPYEQAEDKTLLYILGELKNTELIEYDYQQFKRARLTFAGWKKYDELKQSTLENNKAFMAMAFKPDDPKKLLIYNEFMTVYPKFQTKLLELGYNLENPLETTPKEGQIDARLEAEIRKCRFLVADLSLENEGAYWEAGFAHGLGKPVFYVCKEGARQHFDTNHHTTIFWNPGREDEAAQKLKDTIFNTIGNA